MTDNEIVDYDELMREARNSYFLQTSQSNKIRLKMYALMMAFSKAKGTTMVRLLGQYVKDELKIKGEISDEDAVDLMDVWTQEEAEYAIRYIRKKYGSE